MHPDLTLAILAGGRGTRMGGLPKPLMTLEGRTFLERLLDLRAEVADALILANDASLYSRFGARIVPDRVADRGAPGGLHAALHAARTGWVVLVAGDMPFVTPAAVGLLAERIEPGLEWICFERDGRLEPMPGLYRVSLRERFDARLAEDSPSFRAVLEGAPGLRVPAAELSHIDPELRTLMGVNTPEEAARIGAKRPPGEQAGPKEERNALNPPRNDTRP